MLRISSPVAGANGSGSRAPNNTIIGTNTK